MKFVSRPISILLSAWLFAWCASLAWCGEETEARPNVLFICSDDHAPYVMGAYGNTQVRTPHLDRLASAGMRFDRAYCNSPVCTASRQSFLTGRYPRTIGVTRLQTPLPDSELTLAELLADAGYATAAFGKMHFNSNLQHGFAERLDLADHRRWLAEQPRVQIPPDVEVLPDWRPFRDPAAIWLNGIYRPYAAHDQQMASTWLAEHAVEWLARTGEQPFFLMVSFYEPHSPFHFPIEYAERHDPDAFDVPRVAPDDEQQIPACFRDLTETDKQGITAAYYTSVEFLDKNVGLVLEGLQRSGAADNTLVVYIGDHGYLLGQHGRFEKHTSYEEAIRSPLVMRLPSRIEAGSTAALVEFIDLVPTILELCEVEIPATVQGRSLVPVLTGAAQQHRDEVFIEYAPNEEAAIRTDRWKLVYTAGLHERDDGYKTGEPPAGRELRLYDVAEDPQELHNVAGQSEHRKLVHSLLVQLAAHMRATAREPERLPAGDLLELLDFCVQSRDVSPSAAVE